jgi:hypothetical protein
MKGIYTLWGAVVFLLFNSFLCNGQQTVGLFSKSSGSQDGFVLFSSESSHKTYLIDKCGKEVHEWNTNNNPALHNYLLPNGNLLSTGILSNPWFKTGGSSGGLLQILDWNGSPVWRYTISDSIAIQNHDVYPMPNGNILVLEWERFTPKMAVAAGRDSAQVKNSDIYGVRVQEIKPFGTDSAVVVWQWRIWDHLVQDHDSTKRNFGVVANHPELLNINYYDSTVSGFGSYVADWIHANAVTYNAQLDQVMVSSRSLSEIWVIDHSTSTAEAASHSGGKHHKGGDFLYRWGNPQVYNRGTAKDRKLFVQHNPSWIPDGLHGAGTIAIFNNGTGRPQGNYTTVETFSPPVSPAGDYYLAPGKAYGPDSSFWTYSAPKPTDFYSPFQGGLERLPNGNTLICEAAKGNFFEIDSNKNVVWRYVNPDVGFLLAQKVSPVNNIVFRTHFYPLNYSAFNDKLLKPGQPLEQYPNPYSCYMPYPFIVKPVYTISQLKKITAYGVADSLNAGTGFLKGVVQSTDIGSLSLQFSMFDNTGNISVTLNKNYYTPAIGDSVLVHGTVHQDNGLIVYAADTIILKAKGKLNKNPKGITQFSEVNESDLVTLKNVSMVSKSDWNPAGSGFDVKLGNGKDTFTMYISSKTDLFNMPAPWEQFNLTGIEIQNKSKSPFYGGYKIVPRGSFDIQKVTPRYFIWQLKRQDPNNGISDSAGSKYPFYLKGIVQSPNLTKTGYFFSIKDFSGAIFIFSPSTIGNYTPAIGDSILVKGVVVQNNGVTGVNIDSLSILKNASPFLFPGFVYNLNEYTEAHIVKYTNAWLVNPAQWSVKGEGFPVDITNGYDTIQLYISNATDVYNRPAPRGKFNITGIGSQNKPMAPFYGGYQLIPRSFSDFKFLPVLLHKIREVKTYNPKSGIADSVHTYCYLKGTVQSPNLSGKSSQLFALQDSTGSIMVASDTVVNGYQPQNGDVIMVRGMVSQSNGLTGISIDSVSKIQYEKPQNPVVVTGLDESMESELVTLRRYKLLDSSKWDTTGAPGYFRVKAGSAKDTITLSIVKGSGLYSNSAAPPDSFDVTGIVCQDDTMKPYFTGYYLVPRSFADIMRLEQVHITTVKDAGNSDYKVVVFPNPASGVMYVSASFNITEIEISDLLGKSILQQRSASPFSTIDISGLQHGVYFIKVYHGTGFEISKIIKK